MEAGKSRFEVGSLLSESFALVAKSSWRAVVAGLVLIAVGVLLDLKSDGRSANVFFSFASLVLQWWLTAFLLAEYGKGDPGARGTGSIIGVSFLSGLGIVIGLVFLVIPGIVLLVRWSMAIPLVLSHRDGAAAALRESWYRTQGHFWPILALFLVIYVPMFVVLFAIGALLPATMPVAASVLVNVVICVALIFGWHAAVALFFASDPPTQSLEEVFA
jgi:hypothetical protein